MQAARQLVVALARLYAGRVTARALAASAELAGHMVTTKEAARWARAEGLDLTDGRGRPRRLTDAECRMLLDLHEGHGATHLDLGLRFGLSQGALSDALRRAREAQPITRGQLALWTNGRPWVALRRTTTMAKKGKNGVAVLAPRPDQTTGPLLAALQDLLRARQIRSDLAQGRPVVKVTEGGVQSAGTFEDADQRAHELEQEAKRKLLEALMPDIAGVVGRTVANLVGKVHAGELALLQDAEGRWYAAEPAIRKEQPS